MPILRHQKIIYYYIAGAITLFIALKLFPSQFFKTTIDILITGAPFIIIILAFISGLIKYKANPENVVKVRHQILSNVLSLLVITLIFYILYSPRAFIPIIDSLKQFGTLFAMDDYFLVVSYLSIFILVFSIIYFAVKLYQRTKGTYEGSTKDLFHHTLYSVFFIFAFLFSSSFATYPEAYKPVTSFVSDVIYNAFLHKAAAPYGDDTSMKRITSIRSVLADTYTNLKDSLGDTNSKFTTNITQTKDSVLVALSETNTNLKDDMKDKLDLSGGSVLGELTIEEELKVENTSTLRDVIPEGDDSYDLGSDTIGWDNIYVHRIHGSSIVAIGSRNTSHGMGDTNDFLISGDFEVDGTAFFDGTIDLGGNRIINMGDPVDQQDAATKTYVDTQLSASPSLFQKIATVLSPTTSGDSLDMLNAVITNIGDAGTDFTGTGGLNLAGALDVSDDLTISGNLNIPNSTSSVGVINFGSDRFIHNYGTDNTFVGEDAGNFTMSGTGQNVAVGKDALNSNTTGLYNTTVGYESLYNNTTGQMNSAMGRLALYSNTTGIRNTSLGSAALYYNTTGNSNVALGYATLFNNTTGYYNAALGTESLFNNTTGSYNTASGYKSLYQNTTGVYNIAVGYNTLYNNTTGLANVAVGSNSLNTNTTGQYNAALGYAALSSNTTANYNTAIGGWTLASNTTGYSNTAIGYFSLKSNTTGNTNVAMGENALSDNTTGISNTAIGYGSLANQTTADTNTAIGSNTMNANTTGSQNLASGYLSLYSNTTGSSNTALGAFSMRSNTTGQSNTAIGVSSLQNNTTGLFNVALSTQALFGNTTGNSNIAAGYDSLRSNSTGSNNIALGQQAGYSALGSGNVFLGYQAGYTNSTGSNNVFIGYQSGYSETGSNKLHIDVNDNPGVTPLIYGDFSTDIVNINGNLGINDSTPDTTVKVVGSLCVETDANDCAGSTAGTIYAINTTVQAADYAEYFRATDTDLKSGEAVCIDKNKENSVKRCTDSNDVMGIVSTDPAILGNAKDDYIDNENYKIIGMLGQVPGRVANENGQIQSGDSLTASQTPGYLRKANPGESTVGIALESSNKQTDQINVLISRKNKSITVEEVEQQTTQRIAEMNIEEEVNNLINSQLTAVESDTESLRAQIANLDTKVSEYEDIMDTIQSQMEELKQLTDNQLALAQIDLNKNDIDFIKLTLGTDRVKNPEDIDILGQLSADGVVAGAYAVKNTDKKETIGTATIEAGETEVVVENNIVNEKSKIFVTLRKSDDVIPLKVSNINEGEFKVEIGEAKENDIEFDWWVIQIE